MLHLSLTQLDTHTDFAELPVHLDGARDPAEGAAR